MKKLILGGTLLSLLNFSSVLACSEDGKEGFLPENDLNIPVNQKRAAGLSEEQFNAVIEKVEVIYAPIVESLGGELNVSRGWSDGTVNAYASRSGKIWNVMMFGGLARHDTITEDGFALVVCHELGHHIGGAPKKDFWGSVSWASNEGQSDYFATLKCLRKTFLNEDNETYVANLEVPEIVKSTCAQSWSDRNDQLICIRGAMAGDSVAKLFAALRKEPNPAQFETPDPKVATATDHNHPGTQCRLDTYYQGALCQVGFEEDVDQKDEVKATCHKTLNHDVGLRPHCWFKASVE